MNPSPSAGQQPSTSKSLWTVPYRAVLAAKSAWWSSIDVLLLICGDKVGPPASRGLFNLQSVFTTAPPGSITKEVKSNAKTFALSTSFVSGPFFHMVELFMPIRSLRKDHYGNRAEIRADPLLLQCGCRTSGPPTSFGVSLARLDVDSSMRVLTGGVWARSGRQTIATWDTASGWSNRA